MGVVLRGSQRGTGVLEIRALPCFPSLSNVGGQRPRNIRGESVMLLPASGNTVGQNPQRRDNGLGGGMAAILKRLKGSIVVTFHVDQISGEQERIDV